MPEYTLTEPFRFRIRARGFSLQPSLLDFVESSVRRALRRFSPPVRSVDVRLVDVNGPRGGYDTQCRISVELHGGGPVVVEETGTSTTRAVMSACRRLTFRIGERLNRWKPQRRKSA